MIHGMPNLQLIQRPWVKPERNYLIAVLKLRWLKQFRLDINTIKRPYLTF